MYHTALSKHDQEEVHSLFYSVFTSSAGEEEGGLVGNLASKLAASIDNEEVIGLATVEAKSLIGVIFLTRLHFEEQVGVYMLAPVAVCTEHQGTGIGQTLIRYGLEEMRNRSVSVVITYGDSKFYSKSGFQPLSEEVIKAPLKLSIPEGWLGQSLTEAPIPTLKSRPTCVNEFNDPVYW